MSFSVALSGLNSASTDLRVTSNNIANANTTAFKSSRAEFADVFTGDAIGIGAGVRLSQTRQDFAQGNIDITERQLDLAISGKGFFVLNDGGSRLYSRVGSFGLDPAGYVQNAEGERLQVYEPLATGGFNQGQLIDLRIQSETLPPVASTLVDMNVNLPAGAAVPGVSPFSPTDPESYNHSTSTVIFDTLGVAHTATYFFSRYSPWSCRLNPGSMKSQTSSVQWVTPRPRRIMTPVSRPPSPMKGLAGGNPCAVATAGSSRDRQIRGRTKRAVFMVRGLPRAHCGPRGSR